MRTKHYYLLTLLLMLFGGRNVAWAESVTFGYETDNVSIASITSKSNPTVSSGVVTLTVAGGSSSGNVEQNDGKLKFQQTTTLTISVADGYSISEIIITNEKKKWALADGAIGTITYSGPNDAINTWAGSATSVSFINNIANDNLNVNSVSVTYAADSRQELTQFRTIGGYVTDPKYMDDVTSSKTITSNGFLIGDDSQTAVAQANLTITSSNTDIITIGNTSWDKNGNNDRVWITYNIVGEGEAYIIYSYSGDSYYKPKTERVKITTEKVSHLTTFNGTYPYTWDFETNSWSSSKIQLTAATSDWTVNNDKTEARPTAAITNKDYTGIDMVKGLQFTTSNAEYLCLDWTNKHVWLNGSVTIPNLTVGQLVEFVTNGETLTGSSNVTPSSGTIFKVTTAGSATFTASSAYIKSITVTDVDDGSVTYPHRWDMTNWTTDLTGNTNYWTQGGNKYYYQHNETVATALTYDGVFYIPEIKGLKFLPGDDTPSRIMIDKGEGRMELGANSQVIIPNTTAGQIIYIDGCRNTGSVTVTNATLAVGVWNNEKGEKFYISKGGDVTISNSQNGLYLYKIAVNNALTLKTSDPENDETGVAVTKAPVLTTNYNVTTASLTVKDENNVEVAGTVNVEDGDKITFTPTSNFSSWTTYTITVPVGGIVQKIDPNYSINSEQISIRFTTTGMKINNSTPANGAEIVGNSNLLKNSILIFFDGNVSGLAAGKVLSAITISDGTTSTTFSKVNNSEYGQNHVDLDCPVTLSSGKTYTVTIPKGIFTNADGLTNDDYTFSFTVDASEPGIQMVIPSATTDVSVATRIVVNSDYNNKLLAITEPFTATLSAEGESDITLTAVGDGNYHGWAFKPESALTANKTYTLTIPANSMVTQNGTQITEVKTFTFTTGSISGEAPILLKTSGNSSPYEGQVIPGFTGANGTVTLKFNQNISLIDGTKIDITPIGGSEYNTQGVYYSDGAEGTNITVNGDQLSFDFNSNDMHYDLYYKVILPANTVLGVGGRPNAAAEYIFKVAPADGYASGYNFSTKTDAGYPYTWDFTVLGNDEVANIKASSRWTTGTDNGSTYYARKNMNSCFGKELHANDDVVLNDWRGLRIASKRANTSNVIRIFNIDDAENRFFRLHGNTQYMTIPDVPESADNDNGEHFLYIRARVSGNGILALNAPSYVAEWVGNAPSGSDTGIKVYKVRIKKAGDIPFVCSDVNFYQIAFSTYNKPLSAAGEGYATDCHNYNNTLIEKGVDYGMTETLGEGTLTPYYVSAVDPGTSKTAGVVTLKRINDAVKANQGVVLIGTAGQSYPLFVTSYSKEIPTLPSDNYLTGVADARSILDQPVNPGTNPHYYYVLNNNYQKVVGGDGPDSEDQLNIYGKGIGFYLIRGGERLEIGPYAAYMTLNTKDLVQGGQVSIGSDDARGVFFFKFDDGTGNDATGIKAAMAEGVVDKVQATDNAFYNLRGQRLVKPAQPGLYIYHGRKVMVK